jgi:hypothetical protein
LKAPFLDGKSYTPEMFIQEAERYGRSMIESDKSNPIYLGMAAKDNAVCIVPMIADVINNKTMEGFGLLFRAVSVVEEVHTAIVLAESWNVSVAKEEFEKESKLFGFGKKRNLGQHPRRRECLSMVYEDNDGLKWVRTIPFSRDSDGKVSWQAPETIATPTIQGRMSGLVLPKGTKVAPGVKDDLKRMLAEFTRRVEEDHESKEKA